MNDQEARRILVLYRPGTLDAQDPDIIQALELARQDSELQAWLEDHCKQDRTIRDALRSIPTPLDLPRHIVEGHRLLRPTPGWRETWVAAAAIVVLSAIMLWQLLGDRKDDFAHFRARMVGYSLRLYGMDLVTNRHEALRELAAAQGAPGDYVLPDKLAALPLAGGGILRWRNHPVSMVCFHRGEGEMLFLYVIDRASMPDPPSETRLEPLPLKNLPTLGWSRANRTYLLIGPGADEIQETGPTGTPPP